MFNAPRLFCCVFSPGCRRSCGASSRLCWRPITVRPRPATTPPPRHALHCRPLSPPLLEYLTEPPPPPCVPTQPDPDPTASGSDSSEGSGEEDCDEELAGSGGASSSVVVRSKRGERFTTAQRNKQASRHDSR